MSCYARAGLEYPTLWVAGAMSTLGWTCVTRLDTTCLRKRRHGAWQALVLRYCSNEECDSRENGNPECEPDIIRILVNSCAPVCHPERSVA
jgi:hypothetical protein